MVKRVVVASPFIIIAANFAVAYFFGSLIGKWAFIPLVLIEWCLFLYFIFRYSSPDDRKRWMGRPIGGWGWTLLALFFGLLPLPVFLSHHETLNSWQVWLPWITLALVNPWLEEFYWRGLLMDHTRTWSKWSSILFTSVVFAGNHAVFGVNSELNSGFTVIVSTFILGVVWAVVYHKTGSLRWIIFAHFLVDIFNLSAASFLDLYEPGGW